MPVGLSAQKISWICDCGERNVDLLDSTITTGTKLLIRSLYEWKQTGDYNLSIVFSAMAVECELARLYLQYEELESYRNNKLPNTKITQEALRKFHGIRKKMVGVCEILCPDGLTNFINQHPTLMNEFKGLSTKSTPGTIHDDIEKELFRKRNEILHLGINSFGEAEARTCFELANLAVGIFNEMAKAKIVPVTDDMDALTAK